MSKQMTINPPSSPKQKQEKREGLQSLQKKLQGHSEFIRSKFDIDYNPKIRVFHMDKNSLDENSAKKKERQKQKIYELSSLVHKTQEQIKRGKKIIIDWNQNINFRTTRFPSLEESFRTKRSLTEESIVNKQEKNSLYSNCLIKIDNRIERKKGKQGKQSKQIIDRCQHLQFLISQSMHAKKIKNLKLSKQKKHKNFYSSELDEESAFGKKSDPHFNYSIIQQVEEKQKQFFEKNKKQIMRAINYEQMMSGPVLEGKVPLRQRSKLEQIHDRIICKSKLTLIKSDLAKKFRQIRDNVF